MPKLSGKTSSPCTSGSIAANGHPTSASSIGRDAIVDGLVTAVPRGASGSVVAAAIGDRQSEAFYGIGVITHHNVVHVAGDLCARYDRQGSRASR